LTTTPEEHGGENRLNWKGLLHLNLFIPLLLAATTDAAVIDPCADVLQRAKVAAGPARSLEVLGACLAARSTMENHLRVAAEMMRLSNAGGDSKLACRYAEIMLTLLESKPTGISPKERADLDRAARSQRSRCGSV